MPPSSCTCTLVRPRAAAVVNAEIRALSAGRDVPADWDGDALARLTVLRAEWRAAVDAEAGRAA